MLYQKYFWLLRANLIQVRRRDYHVALDYSILLIVPFDKVEKRIYLFLIANEFMIENCSLVKDSTKD